jgi:uncharacterized membrane protein
MFDTIQGLPLHPLVVHAVVVLLPLAVAGTLAVALVPRWRRTFGPLVALLATAGTALVPVATQSGESLVARVGAPSGDHQVLGGQLLWFALPMTLLLWALVALDRRAVPADAPRAAGTGRRAAGDGRPAPRRGVGAMAATTARETRTAGGAVTVVAALAVIAALVAGFQVYRVGESGARSVWGGVGTSQAG